jgi:hypothetical protein
VDNGNKSNGAVASAINALIGQANAGRCDVAVRGVLGGVAKGWVWDVSIARFVPDSLAETPLTESALRASVAAGDVLTYTAVPPGAGTRAGVDRDRDTWLDRSELVLGTDPADPNSNPWRWTP